MLWSSGTNLVLPGRRLQEHHYRLTIAPPWPKRPTLARKRHARPANRRYSRSEDPFEDLRWHGEWAREASNAFGCDAIGLERRRASIVATGVYTSDKAGRSMAGPRCRMTVENRVLQTAFGVLEGTRDTQEFKALRIDYSEDF